MKNTIQMLYGGYVIRTSETLTARQFEQLTAGFRAEGEPSRTTLGGRRRIPGIRLDQVGPVVVKPYYRGGLIARMNRRHYVRGGMTRSAKEFEWLRRVRKLGIRAPEPIASAHRGGLFYRCWLVSRDVTGAASLAQVSTERPECLEASLAHCRRQVERLIANRILHPDLHPGNVLVDPEGKTWVIDFDRTRYYGRGRSRLAARYRRRWLTAVRKHGLPPELAVILPADSSDGTG
ncbi:MAG: lipopolysaccharide kinase InaA family protein [Desulfobacterales bacterium]|nr:lipopolysaccharide kinase InaA family protein [Desulfobacterales bacterium]MDJ0854602.1 lipopolysaccharide kinase InaA family protein [Desulfobacterales bacterium]